MASGGWCKLGQEKQTENISLQDVSESAFPFSRLRVLYQVEFWKVLRENEILFKVFNPVLLIYLEHFKG